MALRHAGSGRRTALRGRHPKLTRLARSETRTGSRDERSRLNGWRTTGAQRAGRQALRHRGTLSSPGRRIPGCVETDMLPLFSANLLRCSRRGSSLQIRHAQGSGISSNWHRRARGHETIPVAPLAIRPRSARLSRTMLPLIQACALWERSMTGPGTEARSKQTTPGISQRLLDLPKLSRCDVCSVNYKRHGAVRDGPGA